MRQIIDDQQSGVGSSTALLRVCLDYLPKLFFERRAVLRFFNIPSNLAPSAVVDDYGRNSKHSHLVGYVAVLVEIDHFDIQSSVVCGYEDFGEVGKLSSAFSVPFCCKDYEEVSVG